MNTNNNIFFWLEVNKYAALQGQHLDIINSSSLSENKFNRLLKLLTANYFTDNKLN